MAAAGLSVAVAATGCAFPSAAAASSSSPEVERASQGPRLVFVDPGVRDAGAFDRQSLPGDMVHVLTQGEDPFRQMARIAAAHRNLSAIAIISHASSGRLELLGGEQDADALRQSGADLAALGASLAPGGDILLFGCDLAHGSKGRDFVELLGRLTGRDIAASVDGTGHASLGGNWDLEYTVGNVEARPITSAAVMQSWIDLLTITITTSASATNMRNAMGAPGTNGVTYTGTPSLNVGSPTSAFGTFTTTGSNLGLTSGAVLGTGNLAQVPGVSSFFWDGAGTGVSGTGSERDIAQLNFQFQPNPGVTKIVFRIVMGSEEYNEYVGQGFSDNIRILLSGGAYSNTNFALVPGISTGIDIDTINTSLNSAYYRNNEPSPGVVTDSVLDGHTTVISSVAAVVPGTTYTANFAVADFVDNQYNTAAFLGYFGTSINLDLDLNNSTATGTSYVTTFTEGGAAVPVADTDRTIVNYDATTIQSATIVLTNAQAGDVLAIGALPGGITGTVNTGTPGQVTVTLTGASSIANYQNAIRAVTFSNPNANMSTTARNVTVLVNDGTTNSNTAVATINISLPNANLVTVKTLTSGDATPSIGSTVTYQITVTNNGPGNAGNVTLTDALPAGLTATATNGTVTAGTYAAPTWTIPAHANGASATLTLEGTVNTGQAGSTITNTTTAASSNRVDPTTTGDDLTEVVNVVAPLVLIAQDDVSYGIHDGSVGQSAILNVLSDNGSGTDTVDGSPAATPLVSVAAVGPLPSGITLNPDGSIDVAPGTPEGIKTFDYEICEAAIPANCATASVTFTVVNLSGTGLPPNPQVCTSPLGTFTGADSGTVAAGPYNANYSLVINSATGFAGTSIAAGSSLLTTFNTNNTTSPDSFSVTYSLSSITSPSQVIRIYGGRGLPNSGAAGDNQASEITLSWTGGTGNATYYDPVAPSTSIYRYAPAAGFDINQREIFGTDTTGGILNGGSFRVFNTYNSTRAWYVDLPRGATSVTITSNFFAGGTVGGQGVDAILPSLGVSPGPPPFGPGEAFNEWLTLSTLLCEGTEDYSDAPLSGTSYGGARHTVVSGIHLGAAVTTDAADYDDANAAADADDGVSAFPVLAVGQTSYTIPAANITAAGTGTLYAWIDFDGNGAFDASEFASTAVTGGTLAGDLTFSGFTAPSAAGTTFARFRLTSDALSSANFSSSATDGEVEDYAVPILAKPTITLTKVSVGGTGTFTFTGDNGWASENITTVSDGVGVVGTTQTLTAASTATTLTEVAPPGWTMDGATCTGTADSTQPTVDTIAGTIAFTADQTAAGAAIECTVTNTRPAAVTPATPAAICSLVAQKALFNFTPSGSGEGTYTLVSNSPFVYDINGKPQLFANVTATETVATSPGVQTKVTEITTAPLASGEGEAVIVTSRVEGTPGLSRTVEFRDAAGVDHEVMTIEDSAGTILARFPVTGSDSADQPSGSPAFLTFTMPASGFVYQRYYIVDYNVSYGQLLDGGCIRSDLVTVKTLASATNRPDVGGTVEFQIMVTNNGPSAAPNATLTDLLPAGLTYVASTPSQGTYNSATGAWTIGDIANSATATLTIEATVDAVPPGTAITNTTAAATSDAPDPGTTGDDLLEVIETANPVLTFDKTAIILTDLNSDGQAGAGDVVRYTFAVRNSGNVTISAVSVAETAFNGAAALPAPSGETLSNDALPAADSTDSGPDGTWDTLAPGDTVEFTTDYTVQQQDVDVLQ